MHGIPEEEEEEEYTIKADYVGLDVGRIKFKKRLLQLTNHRFLFYRTNNLVRDFSFYFYYYHIIIN